MRFGIHPDYRPVVFRDRSAGLAFLTRSTAPSARTIRWEDGNTYPVIDVEISSASHPFWTGTSRVIDTQGRVEKFRRRYDRPAGDAGGRRPPDPAAPAPAPDQDDQKGFA